MLGIGCLVKDTVLRHELNNVIAFTAYERVSKGLPAGIREVYNDLRQTGIEIDLQTAGYIYNDVLPKSYAEFDSDHDVNTHILKNYNDAIQRAALLLDTEAQSLQISQDKPEIAIVNGLLNMFYSANTEKQPAIMTEMRAMQEAMWKGIQRKLDLPKSAAPQTRAGWEQLLTKAYGYEQLGMTDINGHLNNIADLFDAMKEQLEDATDKLEEQGDYAKVQQWKTMTAQLQASAYSLLFSRGEAKDFMNSILKEAGFSKELKNGKTVIDWDKLANNTNSVTDLRNNIDKVMRDKGYTDSVIEGVKDSFEKEFNDLHSKILEWKLNKLANKEEALGKAVNGKTDLRRLAELNNLGIFQNAHDKLLNSVIGISDLKQEDLDDLEQLAQAASNLYREIDKKYGNDVFASSALQSVQRSIDRIIARNIGDKTVLLKIVTAIKNFFDIYLTSLLMAPFTIAENFLSGVKEIAAPLLFGKSKLNSTDRKVYVSVLLDVMRRGQSFGEEVGSFAPRELYSNSLQYKWKDATVTQLGESMLNLIMAPARIGLLGFDSANKAVITNKTFYNAMFKALTQEINGTKGMTDEQATDILSTALNGKSFEAAQTQAKEILEKLNLELPVKSQIPVNNATIVRLANDLVKANLNSNGTITNEMIESALKGSYHVAGYGLGHEPNNMLSQQIKGLRDKYVVKEQKIIQQKNWDALAWHRLKSTFVNSMILKFTGGATNWMYLRAQSGLGLGLFTGFTGKWNSELDFKNKDTIRESIKDRENARNMIGRAMTGIASNLISYALMYGLIGIAGSGDDYDKKRKRLELLKNLKYRTQDEKDEMNALQNSHSIYSDIRSSYQGNRLFKKLAPDAMLISYYIDIADDNKLLGVLNYVIQTGGLSQQYSTSGKLGNAVKFALNKDTGSAYGELSSIVGNSLSVPVWRAYKEWYKLGKWFGQGDVSSDFKKPSNMVEGLFGGGALEDLGWFQRNSSVIILPGIGAKGLEKFKSTGIETMSDIKNNPEWFNRTYEGKYILDQSDRKKAKEAADKWFKENW